MSRRTFVLSRRPILMDLLIFAIMVAMIFVTVKTAHARPAVEPPVDVATAVRAQVTAALPAGLAVAEVQPAGSVSARARLAVEVATAPHPGWSSVRVWVDGRPRWAEVRLAMLRSVLVARAGIIAGQKLSADDVTIESRPCDANEGWEAVSALAGATALQPIASGAIVRRNAVVAAPPVPRGAQIRVIVQRPGLTVSAPAILERAAHPGERVSARLTNGQRIVAGILIDADTVLVANGERP